jgi:hypothetical protein
MVINKNYRFLLKFGDEDKMKSLLEQGHVFCNTLDYFRGLEDANRGDKHEGSAFSMPVIIKSIKIKDIEIPDINIDGVFRTKDPKFQCNLYCMYGAEENDLQDFYDKNLSKLVDRDSLGFGSHFVFIFDPKEFIRRVGLAIEKEGYKYTLGTVQYRNLSSFTGKMGVFDKAEFYRNQKEVRFCIHSAGDKPIKICIGNINDIAGGVFPAKAIDSIEIR